MEFREVNLAILDDCAAMARWQADPAIRHLATFCPDAEAYKSPRSAEQVLEDLKKRGSNEKHWMILVDGQVAGDASLQLDPHQKYTKDSGVAWFGLTIGEAWARGKGIGREAMRELEKQAMLAGATLAEVGVFEFNEPSLKLVRGAGYLEIARIEDFTWWNGRKWADLRFVKDLSSRK